MPLDSSLFPLGGVVRSLRVSVLVFLCAPAQTPWGQRCAIRRVPMSRISDAARWEIPLALPRALHEPLWKRRSAGGVPLPHVLNRNPLARQHDAVLRQIRGLGFRNRRRHRNRAHPRFMMSARAAFVAFLASAIAHPARRYERAGSSKQLNPRMRDFALEPTGSNNQSVVFRSPSVALLGRRRDPGWRHRRRGRSRWCRVASDRCCRRLPRAARVVARRCRETRDREQARR